MAVRPGPSLVRRQLGAELRRLREATGRTSGDVARALGWSDSKLSRIETARIGISADDLDRLCRAYKIDSDGRDKLLMLARQGRQRGWWEQYGGVLPNPYEAFIGYEAEATEIFAYEAMSVSGLLQTNEYARAIIEADSVTDDPEVISSLVRVRISRQEILTRHPAPQLVVVLDESVLRRQIGGDGVMNRQIRALVTASGRPNVTIQILPFATGAHRGLSGSFMILRFSADWETPLVFCEGMTGGVIRTKSDDVRSYQSGFDAIRAAALSPEESVTFLSALADQ